MDGILQGLFALVGLVFRLLLLAVGTPLVLLWPRQDKSLTYGQTVWSRFNRLLTWSLA